MVIIMTIEDIRGFEKRKDIGRLIKALRYGSNRVIRARAAVALGRLGNQKALKPLIKVLNDTKGPQLTAAWALGVIGDDRAIGPLIQVLRKVDEDFRDTIIFELVRFGELAEGPLKELMKDETPAIRKAGRRYLKGM